MENPAGYCDHYLIAIQAIPLFFLKMENPAGYCDLVSKCNLNIIFILPENGEPCGVLRLVYHWARRR